MSLPTRTLDVTVENEAPPSIISDADCQVWKAALGSDHGLSKLAHALDEQRATFKSGRLGLLFEFLLDRLLRAAQLDPARGIAVRTAGPGGKGAITWGEFDFVFLTPAPPAPFSTPACVTHWEASVKFYLQIAHSPRWSACVGPGLVDTLASKGPKTFLQQLPLSDTPEGRAALAKAFPQLASHPDTARAIRRCAFAKGTLFYHYASAEKPPEQAFEAGVAPVGLAHGHARSWWVESQNVTWIRDAHPNARIALLPRMRWLGGLLPSEALKGAAVPWDAFLARLPTLFDVHAARNECLFIALHDPETGCERTRGFVTTPRFEAGAAAIARALYAEK